MTQKTISLLWGLPGSGKSHYASEQCPTNNRACCVVNCDRVKKYCGVSDNVIAKIADECLQYLGRTDRVIIDGLITTNKVAGDILTAIVSHPYLKYDILFEIVWWTPDVQACLHNDRGRRKVDSRITIENIPFEEPSQQLIEEWNMKKRVTRKSIVKKPAWQVWSQENHLGKDEKLKGKSWCLGGSSGCLDGSTYPVSAGPQPTAFKEFDDLLERLCPQISFFTYKKLYNHTVTTETKGESDYYGGHVEYASYVCDLPKLYDMLKEMGIVNHPSHKGTP